MIKLYLQPFGEGGGEAAAGAGAAPAAAAPAQSGQQTGVKPSDAAMEFKTRTGRRVSVDMQAAYAPQESQQESPQAEGQSPPAATKPTFEELIKGEYKDDFGKHVSSIVQDRLKNSKQAEETLGKLTPALEALFKKNGIADGDIDGLVKKITDDDSLYEEEALQRGIPVDTLKEMKALESEKAVLQRMQAERMQEQALQNHFQRLVEQGEQVKQMYPGFDLRAEMQNPQFVELTRPGVNVDVMTAYRVVHNDEIVGGAMQVSAQKTAEKLSNAMRANASRPTENGLFTASKSVNMQEDPKTWSKDRYQRALAIAKKGGNPFTA